MNRRAIHIEEVKDRIVYAFLKTHYLHEAVAWGFAPYDFKIVHDDLVRRGFEPLPHLSDIAYENAMQLIAAARELDARDITTEKD